MYKTRTMTRDLESIPFDRAFRLCEDAAQLAVATQQAVLDQQFQDEVERLERAWTASHEAPSEVSFADQVSTPTLDLPHIRRRARQRAIAEEFIPQYKLETILQEYIMPQILTRLANRHPGSLAEVSTAEGKIDGKKMLNKIFDFTREWDRGLYYFLMLDQRSAYLKTQYKGEAKKYCALVPLILYAFKLYHNIPYTAWDRETLHFVVNDSLCQAMLCSVPEVSREDLLEIREAGLLYKNGVKQGESRNPVTTYKLYGVTDSVIGDLPEMAQTMLVQIWCAHPVNRTKYMVLNPEDWDTIPAPLVAEQLFAPQVVHQTLSRPLPETAGVDVPWN